jgi:transcriptional regulator GlxA family with amidase domain
MKYFAGYRELLPPRGLEGLLSKVWIRVVPDEQVPPTEIWPDAGIDVIWQQGREAMIAGPDTQPVSTPLDPGAVLVGAQFRPGSAGATLRTGMSELRNQRLPLADVRPDLARRLDDGLPVDEALRRILDAVARQLQHPRASVDGIMYELSIGSRQLRRRFHHAVGYGPKTLHTVLRFKRLVDALRGRPGADLATIAFELGYSDQAHMSRESRRWSGRTPVQLREAVSE